MQDLAAPIIDNSTRSRSRVVLEAAALTFASMLFAALLWNFVFSLARRDSQVETILAAFLSWPIAFTLYPLASCIQIMRGRPAPQPIKRELGVFVLALIPGHRWRNVILFAMPMSFVTLFVVLLGLFSLKTLGLTLPHWPTLWLVLQLALTYVLAWLCTIPLARRRREIVLDTRKDVAIFPRHELRISQISRVDLCYSSGPRARSKYLAARMKDGRDIDVITEYDTQHMDSVERWLLRLGQRKNATK